MIPRDYDQEVHLRKERRDRAYLSESCFYVDATFVAAKLASGGVSGIAAAGEPDRYR
jgi:hypothetical protein